MNRVPPSALLLEAVLGCHAWHVRLCDGKHQRSGHAKPVYISASAVVTKSHCSNMYMYSPAGQAARCWDMNLFLQLLTKHWTTRGCFFCFIFFFYEPATHSSSRLELEPTITQCLPVDSKLDRQFRKSLRSLVTAVHNSN